jgi:hypothetical protein
LENKLHIVKKCFCCEIVHKALTWKDSLDKRLDLWKIGMKLGTRNIMSLQRAVSLITAAKEEEIRKIGTKLVHGTL